MPNCRGVFCLLPLVSRVSGSDVSRKRQSSINRYMTRLFVTEREQVAKRRALEVQTAQQSKTYVKPKAAGGAGGGKRSRVEGSVATAARLGRLRK